MKRILYLFIKNNIRIIPLYFQTKKAIKNNDINYFFSFGQKIINDSNIEIEYEGLEKIQNIDKFVMFSNHICMYDPIMIFLGTKMENIAFTGKKELEKVNLFKDFFKMTNSQFIDRENVKEAMKSILELNKLLKNNEKQSILIFPEGTRSKIGTLLDFKSGSFKLGIKEQVPLIPIAIKGPLNIDGNNKKIKIKISYLEPILYEEYKNFKTTELSELVKLKIKENLERE